MLHEVFYWIFNMSLTATMTGLIIMLISKIKKIPGRLTVFLWIVPFIRLIFPVGLNSPYSLMTLLSKLTTKTIVVYQPSDNIAFSVMNSVMAADSYFPITYKVNIIEDIFKVAAIVWIIIAMFILLIFAVTYFTTIYNIRYSTHLKDNIYLSDVISSPAVYGILKPKIILPARYKDKEIEFIVLHENTHIRCFDNLWRIVAILVVSVHWFNPFCWIFLKTFLSDIELSCDERVLTKIGQEHAKDYASSLLESRQNTNEFISAFGGAKIRTRIENILSFKKLTCFSFILFIILIGTIIFALLTNAG